MTKNYNLFDKYLQKISEGTVDRFGSKDNIIKFLNKICKNGNIALSTRNINGILPLQMPRVIKQDKYLTKCVALALNYAKEVAEGILYDRAINGYEEFTYNKDGECIVRKKKHCTKDLLEYLKANSDRYCNYSINKKLRQEYPSSSTNLLQPLQSVEITNFEAELYKKDAK